jgi:N-acetylglucosamine malate deacetylase 1
MKLDILVFAAHPDDAELGCSGTIAKHVSLGFKVGIVDLTQGELGTRGTVELRKSESAEASKILNLTARENLHLRDGFFVNDEVHQLKLVYAIRKYQPEIVIANAVFDRHIDHGKAASLAYDSCFLSGLSKIITLDENGEEQKAWRPKVVYHYIQSLFIKPDFIVDVSDFWKTKLEAIRAYKSQFFNPSSVEPETYISKPGFMKMIEARAVEFGQAIGTEYGEGFTVKRFPGVRSLFDLL